MMMSEFIDRTGFEPTAKEYAKIEEAYYDFDGDKDAFCKAFVKDGGARKLCKARAAEIDRLNSLLLESERQYKKDSCNGQGQLTMEDADWLQNTRPMLKALARQAKVLAAKYPVVCTNPPYLNKIEGRLKAFVTENYKDYSGDLFSVFTYRNLMFCKQDGYCGYMTPFVWMFIKTYEKLREFIIRNKSIILESLFDLF